MRFFNPLTNILNNQAQVVCLRLLCKYPTSISGRQLAKIVGINPTTVNKALNVLMDEQIILVRKAGKANIYELNKANWVAVKILIPMFKQESILLDNFIECFVFRLRKSSLNKEIKSIALFGSVHEHTEKPTSDIDIFIVIKEVKNKNRIEDLIYSIDADLMAAIGMGIAPYIKTILEFKRDKKLGVIQSMLRSHRVIFGESLEKLI